MCHNEGGASQVYSQCISVAQTYISSMQEHFSACVGGVGGWTHEKAKSRKRSPGT